MPICKSSSYYGRYYAGKCARREEKGLSKGSYGGIREASKQKRGQGKFQLPKWLQCRGGEQSMNQPLLVWVSPMWTCHRLDQQATPQASSEGHLSSSRTKGLWDPGSVPTSSFSGYKLVQGTFRNCWVLGKPVSGQRLCKRIKPQLDSVCSLPRSSLCPRIL